MCFQNLLVSRQWRSFRKDRGIEFLSDISGLTYYNQYQKNFKVFYTIL